MSHEHHHHDANVIPDGFDQFGRKIVVTTAKGENSITNLYVIDSGSGHHRGSPEERRTDHGRFFSQRFLNQSAQVNIQNMFTPDQDGMFQLSVCLNALSAGSNSMSAVMSFYQDGSASSVTVNLGLGSVPTQSCSTYGPVCLNSGAPVTISCANTSSDGGGTYDVFFTVEKLA